MSVYYNEHDPFAAAWLRELIADGLIAPGDVDERDIQQVQADDLRDYAQCHFFAGIGGWSRAFRLAGWPDDRPVWSGSCPCQPLSSAGRRQGHADERHLWPAFHRLIAECRPATVFGEQVAGALGYEWLAGIRADLEGDRYAIGATDLCAPGVGAPHIRQRLYWVADASGDERGSGRPDRADAGREAQPSGLRPDSGLADSDGGLAGDRDVQRGRQHRQRAQDGRTGDGLGNTRGQGLALRSIAADGRRTVRHEGPATASDGVHSFWSAAEWLQCSDGKARRVEPGIQPLAYGVPNRVGTLRGAGNAIVPQVAAQFIGAWLDTQHPAPAGRAQGRMG